MVTVFKIILILKYFRLNNTPSQDNNNSKLLYKLAYPGTKKV